MKKRKQFLTIPAAYGIPLLTVVLAIVTVLMQKALIPKKETPAPLFPKEITYQGSVYLCPATENNRLIGLIQSKHADALSNLKTACDTVTKEFYKCNADKTILAYYDTGKKQVSLFLADRRYLILPQTMAASGIRYTNNDESIVFWSKGESAFMTEKNTSVYDGCKEVNVQH